MTEHRCPYTKAVDNEFRDCKKEHGHQDEHDFGPRHLDLLERMVAAWKLMQEGMGMPNNSTATFVRGEIMMRDAVLEFERSRAQVRR